MGLVERGSAFGNFAPGPPRGKIRFSMDLDPPAKPVSSARFLGCCWRRAVGIRHKGVLVLAVFLAVAGLMALRTALTHTDSSLRLKLEHKFRGAQLWVWLDGELVYEGRLIGSSKPVDSVRQAIPRKKFVTGKKFISNRQNVALAGSMEGNLSETFPVSAGAHQVRVRVANEDDGSVQENSIRGDFDDSGQRTLCVVARANDVAMNWETERQEKTSAPAPGREPAQAPEGWFQRYSGSVLVSIVGSIVSAFTGYVIKELPKKITSTQAEPPKA